MGRTRKLIKSRKEPKTFRGQSRRRLTGDGRRTIKSKNFSKNNFFICLPLKIQ